MHTTTQTDIHQSALREPSHADSSKAATNKQPLWQVQILCHIVSPDGIDKLRVTTSIPCLLYTSDAADERIRV